MGLEGLQVDDRSGSGAEGNLFGEVRRSRGN